MRTDKTDLLKYRTIRLYLEKRKMKFCSIYAEQSYYKMTIKVENKGLESHKPK